ncbi:hypothetical protein SDC9_104456 [bioreactor metagenome]|uniref:Uncharacterized protein n=1 Tax=bioreactor metagenome TaxID=1076179 RepID=A0A645B399_9ZZZZ
MRLAGAFFIPVLRAVHDGDDGQHDGHFDQHADHGGQGCAGLQAEQADGGGHGQLEEVAGTDEGRGAGYAVLHAEFAVEPVGEAGVEDDLDEDGYGQQGDDEGLLENGLSLEREQQHQREQQRRDGVGAEFADDGLKVGLAARQQRFADQLRNDDGDDDVQAHRDEQRVPRHGDGRQAQKQRNDGGEGHHHDGVVEGHLRESEIRIALAQLAPHEDHGGARRCGQQDQACDVAVELVCGQIGREHVAHEDPSEQGHAEGFDGPVDEQRHADAARVGLDLPQRGEVDLQQHGDDHHPDEHAHGQVDLCDLHGRDGACEARQRLAKRDARNNAQQHPDGEIAFKKADTRGRGDRVAGGGVGGRHGVWVAR